ncbi:hypothetical protein Peur_054806 [Populus x canadensis]|uniref:RING-type domain-containing protein n=1 Tax=Populus deltoides TaxID=3696 RepID=A0A8T2XUS9_POPDE|nr:hypothetical protein H0E87_019363 [Populus deltoides]
MMWRFASNALTSIGLKKSSREANRANLEFSDDEVCSNLSGEEGLECPICWESFNIVENVPYVLWCGHSLCENCVLGLQCAVLGFSMQKIRIPFFVSCPWCQLLSFRLVYQGSLKFPRKNFFLLWMVQKLNGDRVKFSSSLCTNDNQPIWSPKGKIIFGHQFSNSSLSRAPYNQGQGQLGFNGDGGSRNGERNHSSLHKSLDYFLDFTTKFPLVIIFLLVLFVVPISAVIVLLYLLVTVLFALPSFLVLYFAYPTLARLVKEIAS